MRFAWRVSHANECPWGTGRRRCGTTTSSEISPHAVRTGNSWNVFVAIPTILRHLLGVRHVVHSPRDSSRERRLHHADFRLRTVSLTFIYFSGVKATYRLTCVYILLTCLLPRSVQRTGSCARGRLLRGRVLHGREATGIIPGQAEPGERDRRAGVSLRRRN